MARPKLEKLLYMLGVYSNKTIPQTYIGEFSNYELLLTILQKVNEVIERCNLYDEIINEISKLLDDLDAEIREKVEEVINQMYEDGDLTPILKSVMEENPDIIQDILKDNPDLLPDAIKDVVEEMITDGSLNGVFQDVFAVINDGKHSTLELSRKYRALFQAHSYNATTIEEELYSAMQGACHFDYNGNHYIAIYLYCSNNSEYHYNDNGRIRIYQDNGTFVIEKYVSWGHCNALAFDETNGYLYGAESSRYDHNHTATYSKRLYRVRFTGSAMGDEESRTVNYGGNHINGVMWYDDQLYVCQGLKIYEFDWDTANTRNIIDLSFPANQGTIAGWAMTEDYIYCGGYSPNTIVRINRKELKVDWVYYLSRLQNQEMFRLGEIEGISVDKNNNLWVFTFQRMQTSGNLTHHLSQVFIQNLTYNNITPSVVRVDSDDTNLIYIDDTAYMKDDNDNWVVNPNITPRYDFYNPNGTKERPFSLLQEAVSFVDNSRSMASAEIRIFKNNGYHTTISSNKSFWIRGGYANIGIGGLDLSGCTKFRITDMTINNRFPVDQGVSHNSDSVIYAVNSMIFVTGCSINNYNSNASTGIYCNGSLCYNADNTYSSNVSNDKVHNHGNTSSLIFGDYS